MFQQWMQDLNSALTKRTDERRHVPKSQRTAHGKGDQSTLSEKDCEWVSNVAMDLAQVVATHANKRFDVVEKDVSDLRTRTAKLEAEIERQSKAMDEMKEIAVRAEQKAEEAKIAAELAKQQVENLQAQGPPSSSSSHSGRPSRVLPWEDRDEAIIGNLGWDCPELDLCARAKELLGLAEVPEADWESLVPGCRPGGKGSICRLRFKDPPALRRAIAKVRSVRKTFQGAEQPAWLGVQKTQEELRPGRMLRTLVEMLGTALSDSSPRVTKDDRIRAASVNGVAVASVSRGRVCWSTAGEALVNERQRSWITGLVEATV